MMPCLFCRMRQQRTSVLWRVSVRNEDSYFGTSVFQHAKNRSLWLMLLMLSATVTGEILGHYEDAMAVMPVLITVYSDADGNRRKLWLSEFDIGDPWTCSGRD